MEKFVTIERAIEIARETPLPSSVEDVPLHEALNRILAQDLASKVDDPAFDNSAMDGWAVRSQDTKRVEIGRTTAGEAPNTIGPGEAIRIMTGAHIPTGADAIVVVEDGLQGEAKPHFIRRRGENLRMGETALFKGQKMSPSAISLAATMGYKSLPVYSKLRVAVISTGDELVQPGIELGPGEIYESNSYGLCALLEKIGCIPILHDVVQDSLDGLRETLNNCDCDLIITSGGVSMGDRDFVRKIMEEEGTIHFWKVAMRPGGPPLFGSWKQTPLFGLPGNPVSSHLVFQIIVAPWIAPQVQLFKQVHVEMLEPVKGAPNKTCFRRIEIVNENGKLVARTHTHQGSGNIHSMVAHNGLTRLPPNTDANIGDRIEALWFTD
ncbi:MAG: molybdopterin molybdotransferase MoeA [Candidatus Thermoplasmatota archaeon]|nr:molybdopterin molybdotransferase MoeA [Candidatus Thermoplasmatota archaeon]